MVITAGISELGYLRNVQSDYQLFLTKLFVNHSPYVMNEEAFLNIFSCAIHGPISIWVRSRNCGCLVAWFCYQLIAKPGDKTAAVS